MFSGDILLSIPIVESRPKSPNTWSPWMCEMKIESIFIGEIRHS